MQIHRSAEVTRSTPENRRWWLSQNIAMIAKLSTNAVSCHR